MIRVRHGVADQFDDYIVSSDLLAKRGPRVSPPTIIAIYCVAVVLSSLLGGMLPSLFRLTHRRIQFIMSGVGGLMLGIGVFHLLPHSVNNAVSLDRSVWWLMLGLLTTFVLIRVFHAHEHAPAEVDETSDGDPKTKDETTLHATAGHAHCDHGHDHHSHDHDGHGSQPGSKYRWVGIAFGLSLHTLLDGVILSAAVLSDKQHSPGVLLMGFAAFVGIALHKPLDSLSITALMAASGWSTRIQQFVNFGYATMCPLGAMAFYFGVQQSPDQSVFIGCALAFSAGIFICIALADLLPELQFHSHDRIALTTVLLLGVVVAYGIRFLEPGHLHDHGDPSPPAERDGHGR